LAFAFFLTKNKFVSWARYNSEILGITLKTFWTAWLLKIFSHKKLIKLIIYLKKNNILSKRDLKNEMNEITFYNTVNYSY